MNGPTHQCLLWRWSVTLVHTDNLNSKFARPSCFHSAYKQGFLTNQQPYSWISRHPAGQCLPFLISVHLQSVFQNTLLIVCAEGSSGAVALMISFCHVQELSVGFDCYHVSQDEVAVQGPSQTLKQNDRLGLIPAFCRVISATKMKLLNGISKLVGW